MNRPWGSSGLGWILALLVLIACFVLFLVAGGLTPLATLVLIGMLALALLV